MYVQHKNRILWHLNYVNIRVQHVDMQHNFIGIHLNYLC